MRRVSLAHRDTGLREYMDDPACDPEKLRRTFQRFRLVNRAVAHWSEVYRRYLKPMLREHAKPAAPLRMLDIGAGSGDVLRHLMRLAARDGYAIEAVGIDPDPRAISVANQLRLLARLKFRVAHASDLLDEGERFDAVISNHLVHHLSEEHFDALLSDSATLSTCLTLHSDIARSRLAYAAYGVASVPLAPGTFVRVDGLRSIRRSYTPAELTNRLPAGWSVERPGLFRLCAVHQGVRQGVRRGLS